jgi:hypothetical protein
MPSSRENYNSSSLVTPSSSFSESQKHPLIG